MMRSLSIRPKILRDLDDLVLLWKSNYVKKRTRVETYKLFLFFEKELKQDELLNMLKEAKILLREQMATEYILVKFKSQIISVLSQLKSECGEQKALEQAYRINKNNEKQNHKTTERSKVRKVYSDFVSASGSLFPFVKEVLLDFVNITGASIFCDHQKKKIQFYTQMDIIEFERKLLSEFQDKTLNWQTHDFEYISSPQNSPLVGMSEEAVRSEIHSCGNLFPLSIENSSTPLGTLGHFIVLQTNPEEGYEENEEAQLQHIDATTAGIEEDENEFICPNLKSTEQLQCM